MQGPTHPPGTGETEQGTRVETRRGVDHMGRPYQRPAREPREVRMRQHGGEGTPTARELL